MRLFDFFVICVFAAGAYFLYVEREQLLLRISSAERESNRLSREVSALQQEFSAQSSRLEADRRNFERLDRNFSQLRSDFGSLSTRLFEIRRVTRTSSGVVIIE